MSQRKPGNPNPDIASIVGLTDLLSCYLNDTNKVARKRRLCQTVYKLIRNNFFISWKSAIILRMNVINKIRNQTLFWADKLGFRSRPRTKCLKYTLPLAATDIDVGLALTSYWAHEASKVAWGTFTNVGEDSTRILLIMWRLVTYTGKHWKQDGTKTSWIL